MSFHPNINVWTLGKGARGTWKLQHTTERLDEAIERFKALEAEGKQVALYELGLFLHEGQRTAGQVAFWWSANLNEFMQRGPEDRGVGWSDGFDTWVEYSYPEAEPEPAVLPLPWEARPPATIAEPEERYVEAACEHCGRILPMNQLKRLTHEVRAGRTSGTYRTSRSTSSRFSGRSFSNGSTFGTSNRRGEATIRPRRSCCARTATRSRCTLIGGWRKSFWSASSEPCDRLAPTLTVVSSTTATRRLATRASCRGGDPSTGGRTPTAGQSWRSTCFWGRRV